MKQIGTLVLGADYRALGIARSLGRRDIPVCVLRSDRDLLAVTSRYCRRNLSSPGPLSVEHLFECMARYGMQGWVLFPTGDETAAWVAQHHAELSCQFRLTTPPWDVLRWAYDKRLTHILAGWIGVAHPQTYYPVDREELAALPLRFPVILKPAIKKHVSRFTTDKAWRIDEWGALIRRFEEASNLVGRDCVMVQELIPGGGESQFSYVALCSQGRPLASATARRTRQYPTEFGHSSSFVETVYQPDVDAIARKLLAAMRYDGVVELEFKHDRRDGMFKLLDINPRLWTWHTLCKRAGVDFPYLMWRLARGEEVPGLRARVGVRWVRMSTDLLSALSEMLDGKLSPAEYARSLRMPIEYALLAWDDLLPVALNLLLLAWRRLAPVERPGFHAEAVCK